MAFITRIETAQELKGLFGEYNRDQYEMCTYEGMIEFTESLGEDQELDVIAWCCDLTEESHADTVNQYEDLEELINDSRDEDAESFEDDGELTEDEIQIVVDYVSENTCLICSDGETIAYLTF